MRINEQLDAKLAQLMEDARSEGASALYAVLSLLHASYQHGSHKAFAAHCCQFSGASITPPSVQSNEGSTPTTVH